jgi:ElaB/YqjD/DUF883 family membrane-anchored ribosome-binding protein
MNDYSKEYLGEEIAREGEKLGHRVGQKIGGAVETAGKKVDAAIERVEAAAQNAKESFNELRQEGWEGAKKRTFEFTRKEPFTALLLAVGVGVCLGCWMTKRGS